VVELVTETDQVCAIGVEGEINHGALGTQYAQCRCESSRSASALEHHVSAVVTGPVSPARLQHYGGVVVRVDGEQTERLGDVPPTRVFLHDRHLLGTVFVSQQGRQQSDETCAGDHDSSTLDTFAECGDGSPTIGGGVQQPVRADWPQMRDEDTEDVINIIGQQNDMLVQRIADMRGGVPVGSGDNVTDRERIRPGLGNARDLHVAEATDRVPG